MASLRLPESVRQHLFATGTQTAAALAAAVAQSLKEGLRQRGRASLVVSGGRTPVPFLEQLSSHQLDWSGVSVSLADDRWVPANHADSNEGLVRRHLDRKPPWRLVKKYCHAAGIDPSRLGARGIGIHSLRQTAINDAIRNGASMHEVREFAGHADIRTTEVYFVRKEEDGEVAARRIQIRVTGRKGE